MNAQELINGICEGLDRKWRVLITKLATKNNGRAYEYRDHVKVRFNHPEQASNFMMDLDDEDPREELAAESRVEAGYQIVYVRLR